MVSSIGYSLGAGSGIDTKALIDDLAAAARAPKEAQIKQREAAHQAQISAVAEASQAISSFAAALSSLIAGGTLFSQPSVSDTTIIGATAKPGARIGSLNAQVEVQQLAQGQTIVSPSFASGSAPVGEGELTITTGATSFTETIDVANNRLEGLAKAINDQRKGITASIVNEGGSARLVLKGRSGQANSFSVAVAPGTASGLEQLTFGTGSGDGFVAAQQARDAILIYDGVEVRRASNTVTDLIPDVDLDLRKASVGSVVTIGVAKATAPIKQAVQDFVAAYNELHSMLAELTSVGSGGGGAGPLRGDIGIRDMQRELAKLPATVLNSRGEPATLAEIGVATARDGTLSVRMDQLDRMLLNNPDGVEALFNPTQYSSNPLIKVTSPQGKTKPGTYNLTDLVPASGNVPASGKINGVAMTASGQYLVAPAGSPAVGLVIWVGGAIPAADVTVDAGLGGALQSIRDTLLGRNGPIANTKERLDGQAKSLADAREALERRSETYYNQLVKTYSAMERQVSAFKATQSYLEQQIKAWNSSRD